VDEDEAGRKGSRVQRPRYDDAARFERLPHLQATAEELRQFIEEEDAMVGEDELQESDEVLRMRALDLKQRQADEDWLSAKDGG
jgi:hypothetical protein